MSSRLRRHFVLQTDSGPIVTTYPLPDSVISDDFRRGDRRVFREQAVAGTRIGDTVILAPRAKSPKKKKKNQDDKKGATTESNANSGSSAPKLTAAEMAKMPSRGSSPYTFAGQLEGRQKFPRPQETDERLLHDERSRHRAGLTKRDHCAMCLHPFAREKMTFFISNKAIMEQRVRWGQTELAEADILPSKMYSSRRICVFCAQFFGMDHTGTSDDESRVLNEHSSPYLRENIAQRVRDHVRKERQRMRDEDAAAAASASGGISPNGPHSPVDYRPPDITPPPQEASAMTASTVLFNSVEESNGFDNSTEGAPPTAIWGGRPESAPIPRMNSSSSLRQKAAAERKKIARREEMAERSRSRAANTTHTDKEPTPASGCWRGHRLPSNGPQPSVVKSGAVLAGKMRKSNDRWLAARKMRMESLPTVEHETYGKIGY